LKKKAVSLRNKMGVAARKSGSEGHLKNDSQTNPEGGLGFFELFWQKCFHLRAENATEMA